VKVLHRTLMGQPAGPFVMGHEYAGTVVGLGAASTSSGWAIGWRWSAQGL